MVNDFWEHFLSKPGLNSSYTYHNLTMSSYRVQLLQPHNCQASSLPSNLLYLTLVRGSSFSRSQSIGHSSTAFPPTLSWTPQLSFLYRLLFSLTWPSDWTISSTSHVFLCVGTPVVTIQVHTG